LRVNYNIENINLTQRPSEISYHEGRKYLILVTSAATLEEVRWIQAGEMWSGSSVSLLLPFKYCSALINIYLIQR
jgi:hypothetical protein